MLGQICGLGMEKISLDLPNNRAITLPDNIYRLNQFHAHPYRIISWHVQMMLINGFGVGIRPL
jgi:flagellar biosynthesis regulator FlbT